MIAWLKSTALAALSGLLLAACFPPFEWGFLVWIWPLPLMLVLWQRMPTGGKRSGWWKRARYGFGHGWNCGLAFFMGTMHWLMEVHWAGWPIISIYLALFFGLWSMVAALLVDRRGWPGALALAGLWCGLECLRGWLFTGFGWNGLGVPLAYWIPLAQAAEFMGVFGLAFFPMLSALLLFLAWRQRWLLLAAASIPLLLFAWGSWRISQLNALPTQPLHIAIIQPNVLQDLKWIWDAEGETKEEQEIVDSYVRAAYEQLFAETSQAVAKGGVDLVVWPESAIPGRFHEEQNMVFFNQILALGKFTLITGCDENDQGTYNDLVMLHGNFKNSAIYRKIHLVPFGEFVPWRKEFPVFEMMIGHLVPGDFDRGVSTEPLRLGEIAPSIIPLVCFEDTMGYLPRKFVREEMQIIVNVTNDGWFRESIAARMHFLNARFRAIELRRPMIRAANTGWSAITDLSGREQFHLPPFQSQSGSCTALIPTHPPVTFYAKFGDLFSWVAGIGGLVASLIFISRPQQKVEPAIL